MSQISSFDNIGGRQPSWISLYRHNSVIANHSVKVTHAPLNYVDYPRRL